MRRSRIARHARDSAWVDSIADHELLADAVPAPTGSDEPETDLAEGFAYATPRTERRRRVSARRRRTITRVASLVVVAAALLAVATSAGLRHSLVLATTRQPDPFTELYFTHPGDLVPVVTPGSTQQITFTVTNHEAHPVVYGYAVYVGGRPTNPAQTLALADGASKTLTEPFAMTGAGTRVMIEIRLMPTNQSIHYWVTTQGTGSGGTVPAS